MCPLLPELHLGSGTRNTGAGWPMTFPGLSSRLLGANPDLFTSLLDEPPMQVREQVLRKPHR